MSDRSLFFKVFKVLSSHTKHKDKGPNPRCQCHSNSHESRNIPTHSAKCFQYKKTCVSTFNLS